MVLRNRIFQSFLRPFNSYLNFDLINFWYFDDSENEIDMCGKNLNYSIIVMIRKCVWCLRCFNYHSKCCPNRRPLVWYRPTDLHETAASKWVSHMASFLRGWWVRGWRCRCENWRARIFDACESALPHKSLAMRAHHRFPDRYRQDAR